MKALALERGVPVLQPQKLCTPPFEEVLRPFAPDVLVVTAYGKLLPPALLTLAPHGCVNVHASLLPRFRGAAPIQWAIAQGDAQTGVCLMKMDEGLDTGPVIAQAHIDIAPDETGQSLFDKLARLGGALLREALPRYLRGELVPRPQPQDGVVHAPLIRKEDGLLDFTLPAVVLERRIRAFHPWPGAYTFLDGARLKLLRARVGKGEGAPGTVLRSGVVGLEIACGEGSLVGLELQAEGRRALPALDFLAGHPVAPGTKLGPTPRSGGVA